LNGLDQVLVQRNTHGSSSIRNALQVIDFVGYENPYSSSSASGTNDLVLSTEHFDITISGSTDYTMDYMKHVTLTKGQNPVNCVPFFSYRLDSGTTSSNYAYKSAMICSNGEFQAIKSGSGTEYYSIDIVEFNPTRVRIQTGRAIIMANGTSTTNITINAVDTSKAFIVFYYYSPNSGDINGTNHFIKVRFSSTTNVEFTRAGGTSGSFFGCWWVVESLDGAFTVDHGSFTVGYSGYDEVPSKALDIVRSFMLFSYTFSSTDTNPVHNCGREYMDYRGPNIQATVDRGGNASTYTANTQVITFAASENIRTQQGFFTMTAATDATKSHALASAVTSNRYALFNPNVCSYPYVSHSDTNHILSDICMYTLISGGSYVSAARRSTSYTTYNTYMLLEFPPSNTYSFSGNVTEDGDPVSRNVYAYRRDTGALMASGVSNGITGNFTIYTSYSGAHYVICTDDDSGIMYNLLGYDYVIPATVS
jgi:hypothetical protein